MIDIRAVCDAYVVDNTSNFGLIRSPKSPPDGLTEIGKFHAFYYLLLEGIVILS